MPIKTGWLILLGLGIGLGLLLGAYALKQLAGRQPQPLISNPELISFIEPASGESEPVRAYHLWLKLETGPEGLEQMRALSDTILLRGFGGPEITQTAGWQAVPAGLPLRFTRLVNPNPGNLSWLEDPDELARPRIIPGGPFRPNQDIYFMARPDGRLELYIHLDSGLQPSGASGLLSLTLAYLRENQAISSQTMPPLKY